MTTDASMIRLSTARLALATAKMQRRFAEMSNGHAYGDGTLAKADAEIHRREAELTKIIASLPFVIEAGDIKMTVSSDDGGEIYEVLVADLSRAGTLKRIIFGLTAKEAEKLARYLHEPTVIHNGEVLDAVQAYSIVAKEKLQADSYFREAQQRLQIQNETMIGLRTEIMELQKRLGERK